MLDAAIYLAVFAASLAVGKKLRIDLSPLIAVTAVAVVFTVGLWGGAVLGLEGLKAAVATALVYTLLTTALCLVAGTLLGEKGAGRRGRPTPQGGLVLLALALGVAAGIVSGEKLPLSTVKLAVEVEVTAIILLAGLQGARSVSRERLVGSSSVVLKSIAAAILGGAAAALLGSLLTGTDIGASLMFTWGMGWYSLAGPYAASRFGAGVGLAVFVANMAREQLTYILTPTLGKPYIGLLCLGGATSMDNTLPVFLSAYGEESVIDPLLNGAAMTLITPILLSLAAIL